MYTHFLIILNKLKHFFGAISTKATRNIYRYRDCHRIKFPP